MSNGRARASHRPTEEEIKELVLNLQALLPQLTQNRNTTASGLSILEETCCYIKRLQKEIGDLMSRRLSQLLHDSTEIANVDQELITRIRSTIN